MIAKYSPVKAVGPQILLSKGDRGPESLQVFLEQRARVLNVQNHSYPGNSQKSGQGKNR